MIVILKTFRFRKTQIGGLQPMYTVEGLVLTALLYFPYDKLN